MTSSFLSFVQIGDGGILPMPSSTSCAIDVRCTLMTLLNLKSMKDGLLKTVLGIRECAIEALALNVDPLWFDQDKEQSNSTHFSRVSVLLACVFPIFFQTWGIRGPEVFPNVFRWVILRCGWHVVSGSWTLASITQFWSSLEPLAGASHALALSHAKGGQDER